MFCKNCGNEVGENDAVCGKCGTPVNGAAINNAPPPPANNVETIPNYLVFAILVTVLCCLPFGIVSIVYSSQVNTHIAKGDIEGAKNASQKAKTWAIVSLVCGIVVTLLYVIAAVVGGVEA